MNEKAVYQMRKVCHEKEVYIPDKTMVNKLPEIVW